MDDESDIQALKTIYPEVLELELNTTSSIHCLEALTVLNNEVKQRTAQQIEICNSMKNGNAQLQNEINFAEKEINTLQISLNTIESGNSELRTMLLIKDGRKPEIQKRFELGEQKYENLRQSNKSRYETNPYVRNCLEYKNKMQILESNINNLRSEAAKLRHSVNKKRNAVFNTDKKLVINLAKFLVNEHPKTTKMIYDTIIEIKKLTRKAKSLEYETPPDQLPKLKSNLGIQNKSYTHDYFTKNNDDDMMPKLHLFLPEIDFDFPRQQLEQLKKDILKPDQFKAKTTLTESKKTEDLRRNVKVEYNFTDINKDILTNQYESKNYSKRKLIHILEDVKLERHQFRKIISEVNPSQLSKVDFITPQLKKVGLSFENKVDGSSEDNNEIISANEILMPPTQFADETKNLQEKKKVTFEESSEMIINEYVETPENQCDNMTFEDNKNETINSPNDNSITDNDHNILREHKLDSTPQFVSAKHSILKEKPENEPVTSKFFNSQRDDDGTVKKDEKIEAIQKSQEAIQTQSNIDSGKSNIEHSFTKKIQDIEEMDAPHRGNLSHSLQGILDSMNISGGTTGFQDGDLPHFIDSSIFSSPKHDVEMESNTIQNEGQEVPNFMSGLPKPVSLFGSSSSICKPSTSNRENINENFSFNFNTLNQRKTGGLLSLFNNEKEN